METFSKQVYEEFTIAGDISKVIESGETITLGSCVVEAEDKDGSDVGTSVLDQTTKAVDGSKLKILCRAGSEGASPYKITFKIVTSMSHKWEIDVRMVIRET